MSTVTRQRHVHVHVCIIIILNNNIFCISDGVMKMCYFILFKKKYIVIAIVARLAARMITNHNKIKSSSQQMLKIALLDDYHDT